MGGAQSLHTNSLDEAYALPSEQAVTIALRTQQILAHESGVVNTPDPLGGSYFVERLTLDSEQAALDYFRRIDEMGGMIPAIERGFPQSEIANASYQYQRAVETKEKIVVGVNAFQSEDQPIELLQIDRSAQEHQEKKLAALRARRNNSTATKALDALRRAAEGTANTMPYIVDAVRAYATLGEICDALRDVFGSYQETAHV
jgi:methylmalonyl-CoA mutase N-terminal domain/subunit